ncbi:MAG TPA: DUF922 domain-containing protein [Gaiellaceae bacterium]|nr:DUF922 domain-containing protein [Gaiellaceae bacterium]
MVRALVAALVVAVSSAAAGSGAFHVVTRHRDYTITGTTAVALRDAMDRLGPIDPPTGKRFDARTNWHIDWRYSYSQPAGKCSLVRTNVTVTVTVTYIFPMWHPGTGAASGLAARWSRYMTALRRHESGHANDAIATGHRILRDIDGLAPAASCTALGSRADTVANADIKRANAWDVSYDRRTDHGATQGAVFP